MLSPRLERACGLLLALGVFFGVCRLSPGSFSIDEVTYQLMVDGVLRGQAPTVWNGYEELPSSELASMWIRPSGAQLAGQYPYLYILLASPFQAVWGFRGLFAVSALAYLTSVWLCRCLAFELHGSRSRATGAACLFAIATFSIDYGLAAWPHALAVALLLLGSWAALRAWKGGDPRRQALCALAVGASLALGVGVRIDVGIAGAIVVLPFVLGARVRLLPLAFMALGAVAPVALVCAINWARWRSLSPLSYGRAHDWGRMLLPAVLFAVAVGLYRLCRTGWGRKRPPWLVGSVAAATALALLGAPATREAALRVLEGIGSLALDMRMLPHGRNEPAMVRTLAGGVVYFGTLKKALIQSCPYLGLAIIPWLSRAAPNRSPAQRLAPLLVPGFLLLFYGRTGWHGGMAFNQRYLTLALPFLSIVCADALAEVSLQRDRAQASLGLLAFAAAVGGLCLRKPWSAPVAELEALLMVGPLLLGALIAAASAAWTWKPNRFLARTTTTLAAVGIGWATAVAFAHDLPRSHTLRARNHSLGAWLARHLPEDCLLFATHADAAYSVREQRKRVRVALPTNDDFRDLLPLTHYHLNQGRPVFAAFPQKLWADLEQAKALLPFQFEELSRRGAYSLRRIHSRGAAARTGSSEIHGTDASRAALRRSVNPSSRLGSI